MSSSSNELFNSKAMAGDEAKTILASVYEVAVKTVLAEFCMEE